MSDSLLTEPADSVLDTVPEGSSRRGHLSLSFWGLSNQGVVSLGNFVTNLALARRLAPTEYGIFGLIFGGMVFVNSLHASLVTFPLSVKGAAGAHADLGQLTWVALILTTLLTLPVAAATACASYAAGLLSLAPWIILALLLWQVQETLRRALMSVFRFREVLIGDAISYLGQAAWIWSLTRGGSPALWTVFGVMALTSAAGACLQFYQLRLAARVHLNFYNVSREYWSLGRWMALSNLVGVVNVQAVPWTLTAVRGVGEAAKLLAMGNLLGVTHPAVFGMGNLIVPAASRARKQHGVGVQFGSLSLMERSVRCSSFRTISRLESGPLSVFELFTALILHT